MALKNGNNPDIILIASGSEVSTLVDAAQLLKERKGINFTSGICYFRRFIPAAVNSLSGRSYPGSKTEVRIDCRTVSYPRRTRQDITEKFMESIISDIQLPQKYWMKSSALPVNSFTTKSVRCLENNRIYK